MLNLEVGTIKRKIDSNEYDDEALQEAQVKICSSTLTGTLLTLISWL